MLTYSCRDMRNKYMKFAGCRKGEITQITNVLFHRVNQLLNRSMGNIHLLVIIIAIRNH